MRCDPPTRLPLPSPLLTRAALSEVRNAMRAGFGLIRETIDHAPLPTPVAAVAGTVLRRVDQIAHEADAAASSVLEGVMAAAGIAFDDPKERAAGMIAAALRRAIEALGGRDLLVSDAAVGEALRRARREAAGIDEDPGTAALMGHLVKINAIRPVSPSAASGLVPVAVFAALLAESQAKGADPEAVTACAAIAAALGEELRSAGSDEKALARLFAEFRDHV